ncbi:MAG: DNA-processing protein DprA [Spirochaetaceae bacterium]|jgi:DNA processing protein|nr:DNA-processing protein DprA [Spirochaetaceae bacterium]
MDELLLRDLIIRRIPEINSREQILLYKKFDREEGLSILSKGVVEDILGRKLLRVSGHMDDLREQAEEDIRIMRIRGIGCVSFISSHYPPLLRELYDPPALVFYRGVLPDPERPLVAVVGTRRPTAAAVSQAYVIGKALAEAEIPVVSGLALGIDAMAHRGNLEGGAPTVAVLGSSPDEVYPGTNRALARRIIDQGGVILSEYPPGTGPRKWNFPARNRIISGLARGTVIVEAPVSSGALITARFALEQGRDLWVTSSGVNSTRGEGTRKLAEEGARVISGAAEILREWGIVLEKTPEEVFPQNRSPQGAMLASSLARKLNIDL